MHSKTGFLSLPTEIRLQVYSYFLCLTQIPTPRSLRRYHGLLLGCSTIYEEFETEAIRIANALLLRVHYLMPATIAIRAQKTEYDDSRLHVLTITSLSDTRNIAIGIPIPDRCICACKICAVEIPHEAWRRHLESVINHLAEHFPRFTLYPMRTVTRFSHPDHSWGVAKHQFYIESSHDLTMAIRTALGLSRYRLLDDEWDFRVGIIGDINDAESSSVCLRLIPGGAIEVHMGWKAWKLKYLKEEMPTFDAWELDQELATCTYLESLKCCSYASKLAHACDDFMPYERVACQT